MADSMTVLRKAGPPGTKRNIAVLGDGFAAADQAAYNDWVDNVLIKGVFGHDYYSEDASAYNIYRVNLESVDSGVSVRTYDEHGTPADPSDDTVASETIRNTALGIIFSGSWAHCWLEYGPNTESLLQAALAQVGAGRQRDPRRPQQPQLRRVRRGRARPRSHGGRAGRSSPTSSATASADSPTSTR